MNNRMSEIGFLGRQMGKTTAICKAAKEIGATVIVRNEAEANRVRELFGVRAMARDRRLEGTMGPYLVDTDAVALIANDYEHAIRERDKTIAKLQDEVESMLEEIHSLKDALSERD
jgi:hypothetical protein